MTKNHFVFSCAIFFLFFFGFAPVFCFPKLEKAPDIRGRVWFNAEIPSSRMSLKAFEGKVVFLFFWPMNDILCEKTIPVLNRWYAKYREKGFEVVGIRSSEWGFNISEGEVLNSIKSLEIKFPVVMDEDGSIWSNFQQTGWSSYLLVDRKGFIRDRYFGVLNYKDVETMIKILVDEGGSALFKEEKRMKGKL